MDGWEVFVRDEVMAWLDGLTAVDRVRVAQAIDVLAEFGPALADRSWTRLLGRR